MNIDGLILVVRLSAASVACARTYKTLTVWRPSDSAICHPKSLASAAATHAQHTLTHTHTDKTSLGLYLNSRLGAANTRSQQKPVYSESRCQLPTDASDHTAEGRNAHRLEQHTEHTQASLTLCAHKDQ